MAHMSHFNYHIFSVFHTASGRYIGGNFQNQYLFLVKNYTFQLAKLWATIGIFNFFAPVVNQNLFFSKHN